MQAVRSGHFNRVSHSLHCFQDKPDGELFASGKALFVIPKESTPVSKQNGVDDSKLKTDAQTEHIVDQTENKK